MVPQIPSRAAKPFDNMVKLFGTLSDRLQTIHTKDLNQHANVIRGDLLTLLDSVPSNDMATKLRSIIDSI